MKKLSILFLIITFFSCTEKINHNEPTLGMKIFLDFEFGMTKAEFKKHEQYLIEKGIKGPNDDILLPNGMKVNVLKMNIFDSGKEEINYHPLFTEFRGVEYLNYLGIEITRSSGKEDAKKLFDLIERKQYKLTQNLHYDDNSNSGLISGYMAFWEKNERYSILLFVPDSGKHNSATITYKANSKHLIKQLTPF